MFHLKDKWSSSEDLGSIFSIVVERKSCSVVVQAKMDFTFLRVHISDIIACAVLASVCFPLLENNHAHHFSRLGNKGDYIENTTTKTNTTKETVYAIRERTMHWQR